jgi:hypothetical protein
MQRAGDDPGPACLVAGPEAGSIVTVEVFVEEQQISPVRILLKFPRSSVDRPTAGLAERSWPAGARVLQQPDTMSSRSPSR